MKKRILIINKTQFGYHTSIYKYCQYLKDDFEITHICFENIGAKINSKSVDIHYVNYSGSFVKRGFRFINFSRQLILKNNFDIIFIVYFQSASLLKLSLPPRKFVLEIQTGAIGSTSVKRKMYNTLLKLESKFFKNITIGSESLRNKLKLNIKKSHILPVGADPFCSNIKSFDKFNLLYVGTLNSRNIYETIKGLSLFISKINKIDISYDIVGDGFVENELMLKRLIKKENLSKIVKFHGRVKHKELKPFFENCNIGVSYIPITDYFNCQPPTKTFEYINSGMVCIATNIDTNKNLICYENGVLCDDTPESFAKGLMDIYKNKGVYNSKTIKATLDMFTWKNICEMNLKPYLLNLFKKQ